MKTLNWGLIGCGDISRRRVAPAMRDLPNCELIAVSRAQANLAESFAKEFGAKKWYADWQELVRDPEIDAVYIATPVYLHAAQTIAAAEAGKQVLCEKPMAMNVEECDRMIAACRAHNVQLGVAYYRHFYPAIERIKKIIVSGEIGQPVMTQINVFGWVNPQRGDPRDWLVTKQQAGGGPMFDVGCHRIEVLLNLFGSVKRQTSLGTNLVFERDTEDTATAIFQFESNTCAVLTVTHAAQETQDTLDIFGTKGSIHFASLNDGTMTIKTEAASRVEAFPPHLNLHQPLVADFAEAVLASRQPQVDGELGREVARIGEAINEGLELNH